jgi:CubicO group peptidase (beta-lactamase class C family)
MRCGRKGNASILRRFRKVWTAPALERAMDAAFAEPDPAHPRHTRALVVVYQGRIVAERYAPGFDAAMPLLGWSLTKAALNALVGERVADGKLALGDRALLPEWQGSDDPRRDITLDELLRMTSGLAFDEAYSNFSSDITQMLFVQGDMAGFAASKPLIHSPGTVWHYSGAPRSFFPACCAIRFRASGTICAFRASGCSTHSPCGAR